MYAHNLSSITNCAPTKDIFNDDDNYDDDDDAVDRMAEETFSPKNVWCIIKTSYVTMEQQMIKTLVKFEQHAVNHVKSTHLSTSSCFECVDSSKVPSLRRLFNIGCGMIRFYFSCYIRIAFCHPINRFKWWKLRHFSSPIHTLMCSYIGGASSSRKTQTTNNVRA